MFRDVDGSPYYRAVPSERFCAQPPGGQPILRILTYLPPPDPHLGPLASGSAHRTGCTRTRADLPRDGRGRSAESRPGVYGKLKEQGAGWTNVVLPFALTSPSLSTVW